MSSIKSNTNPGQLLPECKPRSLSEVLKVVKTVDGLSATRRRDLCSALQSLARLVNQSLEAIPADRRRLRDLLRSVHPVQASVSAKRWRNIRAEVLFALRLADGALGSYRRPALNADWRSLFRLLSTKRLQNGLSGLIHYCNETGVTPEHVSDEVSNRFLAHMEEHSLRSKPRGVHRRTCRLWNEATADLAPWPKQRLTVPNYRKEPFMIPLGNFPEGFRAELAAHQEWLAGNDLLVAKQPIKICKPRTITLRRIYLQNLATAAVRSGVAIESLTSLSALINETVTRRAMRVCLERTQQRPTSFLHSTAKTLYTVAQHWLGMKPSELEWLRQLRTRLNPGQRGLTAKNRAMLRQFDSDRNKALILHLPEQLAQHARGLKISPRRVAVKFQIALAIEILLTAPMRVGNLAALNLAKNLSRPGGPRGPVYFVLHEYDVKNSEPIEFPLTASTRALLDEYLKQYRPHLAGPDSPWLFPGRTGKPKQATSLASQITATVFRETGLKMTPHQFRHFAALLLLTRQPGAYELVRRLLGHRSIATTTGYYTGLETPAAVEHYDREILNLREETKPILTPPRTPPWRKR